MIKFFKIFFDDGEIKVIKRDLRCDKWTEEEILIIANYACPFCFDKNIANIIITDEEEFQKYHVPEN